MPSPAAPPRARRPQAHRQFHKYDVDRSGRIELDEFSRLVRELPALEGLAVTPRVY